MEEKQQRSKQQGISRTIVAGKKRNIQLTLLQTRSEKQRKVRKKNGNMKERKKRNSAKKLKLTLNPTRKVICMRGNESLSG